MKRSVLFLLAVSGLVIGCSHEKGEVPEPDAACVSDTVKHLLQVVISDNAFTPSSLTITAGDTVNWSYPTGTSGHDVTCNGTNGSILPSGGTSFASPLFLPGGTPFKQAITVPGNYTYVCTIHGSSMTGTIVVNPRCQ